MWALQEDLGGWAKYPSIGSDSAVDAARRFFLSHLANQLETIQNRLFAELYRKECDTPTYRAGLTRR